MSPPRSAATEPAGAPVVRDHARRIEELGRIILAYSEVTEKLQRSHDQLTGTVRSLREELSETNRRLERKNRLAALGEMAAGMAHEIRNPLGGIQLYASLLAKDVADRKDSLELVRKISGGVKRLEGLVSQVLQFTREIHASLAPMDLAEVVTQAVEYAAQSFADRGTTCVVDGPESLPVAGDALLLGQAVLNLLLNAAEAMERGGTVTVRYRAPIDGQARQFHLGVCDTGPGIPAGVMERIFNPFFTTRETGTGLGLAIVHRIVEAHEGTIVASNQEAGGARFEISV
jgi:signal transduction histidine kinase